jgi:hypothetical protein
LNGTSWFTSGGAVDDALVFDADAVEVLRQRLFLHVEIVHRLVRHRAAADAAQTWARMVSAVRGAGAGAVGAAAKSSSKLNMMRLLMLFL